MVKRVIISTIGALALTIIPGVSSAEELWIELLSQEKRQSFSPYDLKISQSIGNVGFSLDMEDIPTCLLYTSPSPRDRQKSRMPSSA